MTYKNAQGLESLLYNTETLHLFNLSKRLRAVLILFYRKSILDSRLIFNLAEKRVLKDPEVESCYLTHSVWKQGENI